MTAPRSPATSGSQRWVFWIFLALAVFYLGVEHRTHLAGALRWLPLAFLLLCPLMHVFMHKDMAVMEATGTADMPMTSPVVVTVVAGGH